MRHCPTACNISATCFHISGIFCHSSVLYNWDCQGQVRTTVWYSQVSYIELLNDVAGWTETCCRRMACRWVNPTALWLIWHHISYRDRKLPRILSLSSRSYASDTGFISGKKIRIYFPQFFAEVLSPSRHFAMLRQIVSLSPPFTSFPFAVHRSLQPSIEPPIN